MSISPYRPTPETPPELPYTPTADDRRLIAMVNEKLTAAQQYRRVLDELWIECIAMTIGKQWHRYNWTGGFLELPKAPSWVVRAVHNLVRPKVAQVAAALVGDMPQLDVDPESNDETDKLEARTGQDLLKYLQQRLGWDKTLVGVGRWLGMTGTSYVKCIWDPTEMDLHAVPQIDPITGEFATEPPPIDPETGMPQVDPATGMPIPGKPILKGEPARIGQIKTLFVTPFEVYTPPGIQAWDEVEECHHCKVHTLEYIRERYAEKGKYVQSEEGSVTNGGYINRRISDIMQGGSNFPQNSSNPTAIVVEYWRKPCAKYPKGQLLVVCNGVLLRNDVLPYEHLIVRRLLPFVPYVYEPFELRVNGQGMVENLIQLQREYNILWSRCFASVMMTSWPKLLKNYACDIASQSITDQPGEVVIYRGDPAMKPEWWVPPPLSPVVLSLLDRIRGDMDDIAYRHQVSSGSHVSGLSAGVSIQLEQEADNQSFGPIRTLFHASIAEMGMHCLALARQFYDEARLGYVLGENQEAEIRAFSGQSLPDYANVKPSATASTPMSRAAHQQMLFDLYDRGAFGPPGSPAANAVLLERLEFGNVSEMIEEQKAQAVEQARQQFEQQQAMADQAHGHALEMQDRGEAAQLQRDKSRENSSIAIQSMRNGMPSAPSAPQVPG